MSLPRWDDDMRFELLRLKSELKPENFRSLHRPIGLGTLTKKDKPVSAKNLKQQPSMQAQSRVPAQTTRFRPESADAQRALPTTRPSNAWAFPRMIFAHILDLAFILLTLGLGVLLMAWVIDPKHVSDNPELLRQAAPIHFILKSRGIALVFGVYAFFSVYWLFFKLATGATLGESFLDNFRTLQKPRKRATAKDSGDS